MIRLKLKKAFLGAAMSAMLAFAASARIAFSDPSATVGLEVNVNV